jgi:Catalytic LigB subunit of aromatic ring-opening dioxygenase
MSELVAAFASSHSVMLTSTLEDWQRGFRERDKSGHYYDRNGDGCSYDDLLARAPSDAAALVTDSAIAARFHAAQESMARLARDIAAARLDALVIVGDDQAELFSEQQMPSIGIYYGPTILNGVRSSSADWYKTAQMRRLEETAERHYPCDADLALSLIKGLIASDFDITALSGLAPGAYEGHAFSFVHRKYMPTAPIPIVPVFLNTFFPPNQPTPRRCIALGKSLRELIGAYPKSMRIGLMASGGLSHFSVEEDLDQKVIAAIKAGDLATLGALDPRRLQSGSSEILNWLDWLSYVPGYRSPALTGTGLTFASWRAGA